MTQSKEDIVCAFHGDLDDALRRIERKVDSVQISLNELLLWRAGVKGAAAIIAVAVSFIVTMLTFVIKNLIFPNK